MPKLKTRARTITIGAGRLLPVTGDQPFLWGVIFKILIRFWG